MSIAYSKHAIERMAEMGVTQAMVKDLLESPDLTYPSKRSGVTRSISAADRHWFAVVHTTQDGEHYVITVVHRVHEDYIRDGAGYQLVESHDSTEGTS